MKKALFVLAAIITISSCATKQEKKKAMPALDIISKLMAEQQDCWNNGDIDCFMEYYWQSDSLKFISKNGVTYGWTKVLNNYKKGYPNKEAMGRLEFNVLHTDSVAFGAALVVGQWQVFRTSDTLGGHFSLNWKVLEGKWKIVADHTS